MSFGINYINNAIDKSIIEAIFNSKSSKIIPTCSISDSNIYAIWAEVRGRCYIAIFKFSNSEYNILDLNECNNNTKHLITLNEFLNRFKKRDVNSYLNIAKQQTLDEFEKSIIDKEKIIKLEFEDDFLNVLKYYASKEKEDIKSYIENLVQDYFNKTKKN